MSDEQANKKAAEEQAEQEKTDREAKERAERVWAMHIFLDPETGECFFSNNDKVTKQWQVDALLQQAKKGTYVNLQTKLVMNSVKNVMIAASSKARPKGIIKP